MIHELKMETLYQEVLADIRFSKNQQWLITTYAVSIIAFLSSLFDNLVEKTIKTSHGFHSMDFLLTDSLFVIYTGIMIIVIILGIYVEKYAGKVKDWQNKKTELLSKYLLDYKFFLKPAEEKDYITPLLKGVIISTGIILLCYSCLHWLI